MKRISLICLLALCACKNPSAGKFLAQTELTVDTAMRTWASHVVTTGTVKPEKEAQVKQNYQLYQANMLVASNAWKIFLLTKDDVAWVRASNNLVGVKNGLIQSTIER